MHQDRRNILLLGVKVESLAAELIPKWAGALQRSLTGSMPASPATVARLESDYGVGQWAFGCRRLLPRQAPPLPH
jgi:hypothetical protein